jgi:hypothetical protein
MKINFTKINHVQICVPLGEEDRARVYNCILERNSWKEDQKGIPLLKLKI